MEYAKDEIFDLRFNKKRTSIILKYLKQANFIKIMISCTVILGVTNIIFIYNFLKILSTI